MKGEEAGEPRERGAGSGGLRPVCGLAQVAVAVAVVPLLQLKYSSKGCQLKEAAAHTRSQQLFRIRNVNLNAFVSKRNGNVKGSARVLVRQLWPSGTQVHGPT